MYQIRVALRVAVATSVLGAILFASAGRLDLPFFWAYLGALGLFAAVGLIATPRALLEERFRPAGPSRDNLVLLRIAALVVFSSQWIVAGLDARFGWSGGMPVALHATGLGCLVAFFVVWFSAMRSNPFFSAAVRIQHDRGHHVVRTGPYRYVRHPGYAAFVLLGWGGSVALGSWWALLTHVPVVVMFTRRAELEDRMLREELPGYADYAASVRYRLLPGVW